MSSTTDKQLHCQVEKRKSESTSPPPQTSKAKKKKCGRTTNNSTIARIDSSSSQDENILFPNTNKRTSSVKYSKTKRKHGSDKEIRLKKNCSDTSLENESSSKSKGNTVKKKKRKKQIDKDSSVKSELEQAHETKQILDENENTKETNQTLISPEENTPAITIEDAPANNSTNTKSELALHRENSRESLSNRSLGKRSWSSYEPSPEFVPEYCDETLAYDICNEEEYEYFGDTEYFVKDSVGYEESNYFEPAERPVILYERLVEDDNHVNDDEGHVKDYEDHANDEEGHVKGDEKHVKHDEDHVKDDEDHVKDDGDHVKDDGDHVKDEKDHVKDDKDHVRDDKDHVKDDEDHVNHDEMHVKGDEDHVKDDEDHVKDDEDHVKDDKDHVKDVEDHVNNDEKHVKGDKDYVKDDDDHVKDDGDHVKDDKDHVKVVEDHVNNDEKHVKGDKDHVKVDDDHVKDDGGHVKDDNNHVKDGDDHVEDDQGHVKDYDCQVNNKGNNETSSFVKQARTKEQKRGDTTSSIPEVEHQLSSSTSRDTGHDIQQSKEDVSPKKNDVFQHQEECFQFADKHIDTLNSEGSTAPQLNTEESGDVSKTLQNDDIMFNKRLSDDGGDKTTTVDDIKTVKKENLKLNIRSSSSGDSACLADGECMSPEFGKLPEPRKGYFDGGFAEQIGDEKETFTHEMGNNGNELMKRNDCKDEPGNTRTQEVHGNVSSHDLKSEARVEETRIESSKIISNVAVKNSDVTPTEQSVGNTSADEKLLHCDTKSEGRPQILELEAYESEILNSIEMKGKFCSESEKNNTQDVLLDISQTTQSKSETISNIDDAKEQTYTRTGLSPIDKERKLSEEETAHCLLDLSSVRIGIASKSEIGKVCVQSSNEETRSHMKHSKVPDVDLNKSGKLASGKEMSNIKGPHASSTKNENLKGSKQQLTLKRKSDENNSEKFGKRTKILLNLPFIEQGSEGMLNIFDDVMKRPQGGETGIKGKFLSSNDKNITLRTDREDVPVSKSTKNFRTRVETTSTGSLSFQDSSSEQKSDDTSRTIMKSSETATDKTITLMTDREKLPAPKPTKNFRTTRETTSTGSLSFQDSSSERKSNDISQTIMKSLETATDRTITLMTDREDIFPSKSTKNFKTRRETTSTSSLPFQDSSSEQKSNDISRTIMKSSETATDKTITLMTDREKLPAPKPTKNFRTRREPTSSGSLPFQDSSSEQKSNDISRTIMKSSETATDKTITLMTDREKLPAPKPTKNFRTRREITSTGSLPFQDSSSEQKSNVISRTIMKSSKATTDQSRASLTHKIVPTESQIKHNVSVAEETTTSDSSSVKVTSTSSDTLEQKWTTPSLSEPAPPAPSLPAPALRAPAPPAPALPAPALPAPAPPAPAPPAPAPPAPALPASALPARAPPAPPLRAPAPPEPAPTAPASPAPALPAPALPAPAPPAPVPPPLRAPAPPKPAPTASLPEQEIVQQATPGPAPDIKKNETHPKEHLSSLNTSEKKPEMIVVGKIEEKKKSEQITNSASNVQNNKLDLVSSQQGLTKTEELNAVNDKKDLHPQYIQITEGPSTTVLLTQSSPSSGGMITQVYGRGRYEGNDPVSWSCGPSKTYPYSAQFGTTSPNQNMYSDLPSANPFIVSHLNQKGFSVPPSHFNQQPTQPHVNPKPFSAVAGINWYPENQTRQMRLIAPRLIAPRPLYFVPAFPMSSQYSQPVLHNSMYARALQEMAKRRQPETLDQSVTSSFSNKEYSSSIDADRAWYAKHVGSTSTVNSSQAIKTEQNMGSIGATELKGTSGASLSNNITVTISESKSKDDFSSSVTETHSTAEKIDTKPSCITAETKKGGLIVSSQSGSCFETKSSSTGEECSGSKQELCKVAGLKISDETSISHGEPIYDLDKAKNNKTTSMLSQSKASSSSDTGNTITKSKSKAIDKDKDENKGKGKNIDKGKNKNKLTANSESDKKPISHSLSFSKQSSAKDIKNTNQKSTNEKSENRSSGSSSRSGSKEKERCRDSSKDKKEKRNDSEKLRGKEKEIPRKKEDSSETDSRSKGDDHRTKHDSKGKEVKVRILLESDLKKFTFVQKEWRYYTTH